MKKKSIIPLLFTVSLIFPAAISDASEQEAHKVDFSNSEYSLKYLAEITKGLDISEVQLSYPTNGTEVVMGYTLKEKQDVKHIKRKIVQESIDSLEEGSLQVDKKDENDLKDKLNSNDVKISNITFSESESDLEKHLSEFPIEDVTNGDLSQDSSKSESNDASPLDTPTKGQSTPYQGYYSMTSNSHIVQNFEFTRWGLSYYHDAPNRKSFELDTVFYNYDDDPQAWAVEYAGTSGTYWNTNLPSPYLDTNFGDDWDFYGGGENNYGEPTEPTFSVGTDRANDLEANTTYFYTIEVDQNPRGSNGLVKLMAQPGTVIASGPWGTFADETYRVWPSDAEIWDDFSENQSIDWERQ